MLGCRTGLARRSTKDTEIGANRNNVRDKFLKGVLLYTIKLTYLNAVF